MTTTQITVTVQSTNTRYDREGSKGARVTRLAGLWGYWSNGTRTEVSTERVQAEAAARAYVASDASLYVTRA